MSDLEEYLSAEELHTFHKLPGQLRLCRVSTNDIITLNPAELAKRTHCSASAIVNLRGSIIRALSKNEFAEAEACKKRHDETSADYLRLALDSSRKRKSSAELQMEEEEEEVLEAVRELGGDDGIPQSMKKRKRRRVHVSTYEKLEALAYPPTPMSNVRRLFQETGQELDEKWRTIGLLESQLTRALSGGIAPGYITEVSGESGCGKTQLMLHLLLAVQMPEPIGLSKSALYLSTESSLPTGRVRQLLAEHPLFSQTAAGPHPQTGTGTWPSLDNIYTQEINSLEVQERVMQNSVPLLIKRKNIGLVVVDSLTGNYRQEFSNPELGFKENMIRRARTLRKMGALLREYAKHGVAVVVVNQVSDRFRRTDDQRNYAPTSTAGPPSEPVQHGTLDAFSGDRSALHERLLGYAVPRHPPGTAVPDEEQELNIALQEQFYSGWGDDPYNNMHAKNPWGGLSWTRQLSCRITLIKQLDRQANDGSWKRWAKVVFCAWSPNSGIGVRHRAVEYKITPSGIQSCEEEYAEPRTPSAQSEDPYGMEDPAVEAAFLELERNWASQHHVTIDEKQEVAFSGLQMQRMKMQEPLLMTQPPIDVMATHITFDDTGRHVVNEEVTVPTLSGGSGVANWDRRTGTASSPIVAERRLARNEAMDTQAEDERMSDFSDVHDEEATMPAPLKGVARGAAPDPHADSSDSEEEKGREDSTKDAKEDPPPPRRFGSEVPDSEAESDDGLFVEKSSVERQWEADHHVEESANIQIPDEVDPEDNFLHPHTQQEIDAREAEKGTEREDESTQSLTPAPNPLDGQPLPPNAAVKAMLSHNGDEKNKFGRPRPVMVDDKANPNPSARKIIGWVSTDGERVVPAESEHGVKPPDDAFVPSRPYGEAIRNSGDRATEVVDLISMPAARPDESVSKKERRAARSARKEAKAEVKMKRKAGEEWAATPENRRFKECLEKYPFLATREAHAKALIETKGSTSGMQSAYELMCVKRAQAHGLNLLDWPVAQTPRGEYIDVETGFLITKEDAACVLGRGVPDSPIGAFYSSMRRKQGRAPDEDDTNPDTPSRKSRKIYLHEEDIPHSQLSPKSDLPNVIYPSAQPRESTQPESPSPPRIWQQKDTEWKIIPAILPGDKPPSLPPSTPSRARTELRGGSSPKTSGRRDTPILPGMKPPTPPPAPPFVESPVRKVTPVLPPSSPLPVIPNVPSMKRMKKRLPGSQLKHVMNSSDAIEPPQLDDDERSKSKSVEEFAADKENVPRSSPPPSMGPPSTHVSKTQTLSPTKARLRYSPNQRKRSNLATTYNQSAQDKENAPDGHHRPDFEDISQDDDVSRLIEAHRQDPPILPGMKPTKPLPVYKTPKNSHKKKQKPVVTPATPLRPDQLPREDDIDYDALFPSQESPQRERQVFITKQGVKYPASKSGMDFYGVPKIAKEVVYPPTKGQRDAEEAERAAADAAVPLTSTQKKKRVVFKNPPIRALDAPYGDQDDDDEGSDMADILNFAALGKITPKKQNQSEGFLPLTSSPQRPYLPKSAPAKTFHSTSIENASVNALTVSRQPRYASKPSARWQEVQRELFPSAPPEGGFEAVIPSSQPEADAAEQEGEVVMHVDVVETPRSQAAFETTASDDEYGFDAEMLEAMIVVVVPAATPNTATQKRQRQEEPAQEEFDSSSRKKMRAGELSSNSRLNATQVDGAAEMVSPHRAGAQRPLSSETSIPFPWACKERTSALFEKVKTLKAQGLPIGLQHYGPSREVGAMQRRSSGTVTHEKNGARTWRPDQENEREYPMPSIERDEEDVVCEDRALREQAEREMEEQRGREVREREGSRVDPEWLYRLQEKEELGVNYDVGSGWQEEGL